MATLSASRRDDLPRSEFGEPGRRAYPMPDASHARNAKARASEMERAGKLSAGEKARIDVKADRMLGSSRGKTMDTKREERKDDRKEDHKKAEKKAEHRAVERKDERKEHHEHHHTHVHHEAHKHEHHHGGEKPMERAEHMRREVKKVRET